MPSWGFTHPFTCDILYGISYKLEIQQTFVVVVGEYIKKTTINYIFSYKFLQFGGIVLLYVRFYIECKWKFLTVLEKL